MEDKKNSIPLWVRQKQQETALKDALYTILGEGLLMLCGLYIGTIFTNNHRILGAILFFILLLILYCIRVYARYSSNIEELQNTSDEIVGRMEEDWKYRKEYGIMKNWVDRANYWVDDYLKRRKDIDRVLEGYQKEADVVDTEEAA